MTTRKTKLTAELARDIARALGTSPFERRGYDAKFMAQQNLSGKTHYADDYTLKFFHARINECRIEADGLILTIVESVAGDFENRSRGFRFVAFDLFGTVLNDRDHTDALRSKSDKARDDAAAWIEGFNVLAHYKGAMVERAARLKREADDMAKAARTIRV